MNDVITKKAMMRFLGCVCLSLSFALLMSQLFNLYTISNARDIRDVTAEDIKSGLCITGEIPYVAGCFAEEVSTVYSAEISKYEYYVIPFGENYDLYMGFDSGILREEMSDLYEESMYYFMGELDSITNSVHVTATVKPCSGTLKDLFVSFMGECPEEQYVLYYLSPIDDAMLQRGWILIAVLLIGGIVLNTISTILERKIRTVALSEVDKKEERKDKIALFVFFFILSIIIGLYFITS